MKLNKILPAFFIILLLLSFESCKKKYPDGPRFSIYTPTHRLTGEWDVEKIIVNNKDVTVAVLDTIPFVSISITHNYETFSTYERLIFIINFIEGRDIAFLKFPQTEDTLLLLYDYGIKQYYFTPLPSLVSGSESWKILKLKLNKLWLYHTDSLNNNYEVHLKRLK